MRCGLGSLLALTIVASACGGSGGSPADAAAGRRRQIEHEAARAGLPRPVRDLLGDAAAASGAAFQVTYDVGAGAVATVTQAPPDRRVDVRTATADGEVTTSLVVHGDVSYRCRRAGGRWACERGGSATAPDVEVGPLDEQQLRQAIVQLRGDGASRVERRMVAGVAARCLVVRADSLCVSDAGVPLLVETPTSSLRALRYRTSVPDGAVALPAPVTG